jgi:hypothetical protein
MTFLHFVKMEWSMTHEEEIIGDEEVDGRVSGNEWDEPFFTFF